MVQILIAENAPSLNKGEMAIIGGLRESLSDIESVQLFMFSFRPEVDQPRYDETVKMIDVKKSWPLIRDKDSGSNLFKAIFIMIQHFLFVILYKIIGKKALLLFKGEVWEKYLSSDLIIICHDNCFGVGGDPENPLFYFLYFPFLARILKKPTMFFAGSVPDPPKRFNWFFGKAYKKAISWIDVVTLREETSAAKLKNLGLEDEKILVTADAAFLVNPASADRIAEIMEAEGLAHSSSILIGMTISKVRAILAFPELNDPMLSYEKHIDMISDFIDKLTSKMNALIVFVPHCIGYGEELDDRIVAMKIREKCANKERVKVITTEYSPPELRGIIGSFDLMIGERLHSVIAAMTMGVPSIAISYSSDQRLGIIKMMKQDNSICFIEELNCNTLLLMTDEILAQREQISHKLKLQAKIIKQKARLNGVKLIELINKIDSRN